MGADSDRNLVGKNLSNHRSGKLCAVQFLASLHEREASEWIVVFPAGKRTDAPHGGVHRAKTATIALSPNHALVVGRSDLAALQYERSVRVKDELRVVKAAPVALVHAYHEHHVIPCRCFRELTVEGPGHFNGALVKPHALF